LLTRHSELAQSQPNNQKLALLLGRLVLTQVLQLESVRRYEVDDGGAECDPGYTWVPGVGCGPDSPGWSRFTLDRVLASYAGSARTAQNIRNLRSTSKSLVRGHIRQLELTLNAAQRSGATHAP
jgi:hypothetical protein